MSTTEKLPRPPQVTLVGWLIVVGSVFVVISAFESFTAVRSLDTRELLEEYLDGPGGSLGWSIEQGVRVLQVSSLVTAGCAAAASVLGFFALRRDRGARIGLAILALPLFLSGVVTGGFVSSMVAAAAVLLWMQPSRDWFNGKPMATAPRAQDRSSALRGPDTSAHGPSDASRPPVQPAQLPPGEVGQAGRPVQGFGERPSWEQPVVGNPYAGPQPYGQPAQGQVPGEAPYGQASQVQHPGAAAPAERRPGALLWAVVLTLVFGGFSLLSSLASLAIAVAAPDVLFDEFLRQQPDLLDQGITKEQVNATMLFSSAVMSLLSLCAVIAALLLLARRSGGLPVLLIVASMAAAFCLFATLAVPVMLVPGLASAAVVLLLTRPETRAWLKGH